MILLCRFAEFIAKKKNTLGSSLSTHPAFAAAFRQAPFAARARSGTSPTYPSFCAGTLAAWPVRSRRRRRQRLRFGGIGN